MFFKFKELVFIIYGFIIFLFYITCKRNGTGKFYLRCQENSILKKFINNKNLNFLFLNQNFLNENKKKLFSDHVLLYKKSKNLLGYADYNFGENESKDILKQQRGLIIKTVNEYIDENKINTVFEIGTGNGDVINYLAEKSRSTKFFGLDFNVETANKKHSQENLDFVECYALEYLDKITAHNNILFASSTFIFFTPKEIEKYFKIFKKKIKYLILYEPSWSDVYKIKNKNSYYHLENSVFFHNYNYLSKKHNFEIIENSFFSYEHVGSSRKDIYINRVILKNIFIT